MSDIDKFQELMDSWKEKNIHVERILDEYLKEKRPRLLFEAMRYSLFAGGKRLRPFLVILGYTMSGGRDLKEVLPIASAFELIHTFSLIHDDLPGMDDDDYRRGKPSCHKVFGEGIAILAGDALYSMSFKAVTKAPLPKDRLLKIILLMAEASGPEGMIGGQVYDLQAEGVLPTEKLVKEIHTLKTGKLISAALVAGGVAAGVSEETLSILREIGDKLGLAFQITDDILDEVGEKEKMGKKVKKDRERGKCTYVRVFGLEGAKREAKNVAEEAKELIRNKFHQKGKLLLDLADFIVERGY